MHRLNGRQLLAYLAVVAAAFFGVIKVTEHASQYYTQRATRQVAVAVHYQEVQFCRAVNNAHRLINRTLIHNDRLLQQTLVQFASSAAQARLDNYRRTHFLSDLKAARAYRKDAQQLASLQYQTLAVPNCSKIAP